MATQWTAQGISAGAVLPAATLQSIGAVWVDYTPTLTQSATVTKTINHARYCQIQKTVIVQIFLTVTGAGTASQIVAVGLPFTAKNTSAFIGSGFVYDASANFMYNILPTADAGPTFTMFYQTGNNFGSSPAVTLANTDQLRFQLAYEIA
jgi:hypothetical protein